MLMIDATKWEEFYKKMTDDLKPYDHYDDGYRDAMDNVDDWMNGNQVEAEPVRHGRWVEKEKYTFGIMYDCSLCENRILDNGHPWNYCPNCGAKMDGGAE